MSNESVLVYGTLRPGQSNYYNFLAGRTEHERTVTLKGFRMYAGMGFPYVIQTNTDETIVADLIDLKADFYDETVSGLDMLEGYRGPGMNNHYDRVLVTVEDIDGSQVQAWMYVAHKSLHHNIEGTHPVLAGGDWSKLEAMRDAQHMAELDEREETTHFWASDFRDDESHQVMTPEEENEADLALQQEVAEENRRETSFWDFLHQSGQIV